MHQFLDHATTVSLTTVALLFLGAFLDATLGFCFVVMGEVFFLAAGWLAITQGSVAPVIAVLLGAFCADQVGFLIGLLGRGRIRAMVLLKNRRRRMYRRVNSILQKRSVLWIAASRFMGPAAWFTPPIAGVMRIPYRRFALGSAFGVLLAVGGFVALGALSAKGMELAKWDGMAMLRTHFWALVIGVNLVAVFAVVITGGWINRR